MDFVQYVSEDVTGKCLKVVMETNCPFNETVKAFPELHTKVNPRSTCKPSPELWHTLLTKFRMLPKY